MMFTQAYGAEIAVDAIIPNPEQPRRAFNEEELAALVASLRDRGQLQPVLVEEAGNGTYILHDGERRWRACKLAGLPTIHALVRPPLNGTAPQERLLDALVANVQRSDLNPLEEAQALGHLRAQGLTVQEIIRRTGINQGTVEGRLLLLDLDKPLQELVARGLLPRDPRSTRALLSIADAAVRVRLGTRLARPGITISAIVHACERLNASLARPPADAKREPMRALAGPLPADTKTAAWAQVRAAAQAMCDTCDLKASLRTVPEPAWSLIVSSAQVVCDGCSLRPTANLSMCEACPGVELLKRLAGASR